VANFFNKDDDKGIFSDINVTPMVDVMLVLLVIFMVTAPFMMNTIGVTLPKGVGEGQKSDQEPLTISINKNNEIFLAKERFELEPLFSFLKESPRIKNGDEIFIEADEKVEHGFVMKVMSKAYEAGAFKINLLMEKN
jgi:biopolymer transport protein TolR